MERGQVYDYPIQAGVVVCTCSYYSADTPFVSYFPSDPLPLPPSAHFEAVVGLGGDRIYSE